MKNPSGITPVGFTVLVKPDNIETKTAGGIVIPETVAEMRAHAQTSGVLVAHGKQAWSDCGPAWAAPGHRVAFAKYGGAQLLGKDGIEYRMVSDRQINAVLDEGVEFSGLSARKAFGSAK